MERNNQIDFFRGFLLVLIAFNHFVSEDNFLIRITFEGIGWITGASGFVFLSGFTVGLVYTNKYLKKGAGFIQRAAWRRAWLIYRYHLLILLLILLLVSSLAYIKQYWHPHYATMERQLLAMGLGAILLYQPRNLDILPMYAVFLLPVPAIISYLHQSTRAWIVVSGLSFVVYLAGTCRLFQPDFDSLGWGRWVMTGNFDILCWQLMFIAGTVLGYLSFHNRLGPLLDNPIILSAAIISALLFFIFRNLVPLHLLDIGKDDIQYWTSTKYLRPGRLINAASVFLILRFLMVKYPNWFQNKRMAYLGRNSIEVFSFHILLIILLKPLNPYLNSILSFHLFGKYYLYPLETLLAGVVVALLFLAPSIRTIFSTYYHRARSYLSISKSAQ